MTMNNIPELRFNEFSEQWNTVSLVDVAKRVTKKNNELETFIPLTISAEKGLVDQLDYYNNRVASKDISGYYLIKNGEFAYNKSTSKDAPYGAIKRLDFYDSGALSTLYIVFNIFNGNEDYFKYYFESGYWHKEIYKISQEGARNHGLLNISVKDFFNIKINVPSLEEQEKIGNLFTKIDLYINAQKQLIDYYKLIKKSMLQKMLPKKDKLVPEFRFDGFDGEWTQNQLREIGNTYTSLSGKSAEDFGHGDASYVTYMNVYKNPVAYLDEVGLIEKDNKQNEVNNGDFFFTTSSETPEEVGLSSAWIYDKSNVYLNSFCFGFRPTMKIDTFFFAYYFRSENFRREVVMLAQGSTRFNISKKSIMDIKVCFPSLAEQQKIGNFFKNLDTQIETEEKLLESYKIMKKSLLQKMFV